MSDAATVDARQAEAFALIDELIEHRREPIAAFARRLGVRLEPATSSFMPHLVRWTVPTGCGSSRYASLEIRTLADDPEGRRKFFTARLQGLEAVTGNAIWTRYGISPHFVVPRPEAPADAPLVLSYDHPWGTVRFGVTRDDRRLVSLSIDDLPKADTPAEAR